MSLPENISAIDSSGVMLMKSAIESFSRLTAASWTPSSRLIAVMVPLIAPVPILT